MPQGQRGTTSWTQPPVADGARKQSSPVTQREKMQASAMAVLAAKKAAEASEAAVRLACTAIAKATPQKPTPTARLTADQQGPTPPKLAAAKKNGFPAQSPEKAAKPGEPQDAESQADVPKTSIPEQRKRVFELTRSELMKLYPNKQICIGKTASQMAWSNYLKEEIAAARSAAGGHLDRVRQNNVIKEAGAKWQAALQMKIAEEPEDPEE